MKTAKTTLSLSAIACAISLGIAGGAHAQSGTAAPQSDTQGTVVAPRASPTSPPPAAGRPMADAQPDMRSDMRSDARPDARPDAARLPMAQGDTAADKAALQQALQQARSRDDLQRILDQQGWQIAHVNKDEADEVELEIVKGNQSYEVEMSLAGGGSTVEEVDVKENFWRASETKRAMERGSAATTAATTAGTQAPSASADGRRYSDSNYRQEWTDQKQRIEQALQPGQPADSYRARLEQMGWQVTSVNERGSDRMEYEIVRGDQSYEVQIELDPRTQMGRSVDVSTNTWESNATERQKKMVEAK